MNIHRHNLIPTAFAAASMLLTAATLPAAASFTASADTYISSGAKDTPYGGNTTFAIRGSNNGYGRLAYVRFDIGSLLTVSGTVIETASLTFTLSGIYQNRVASTIDVYALNSTATTEQQNWGETTLTFNTAPWAPYDTSGATPSTTTYVGSFSVAATGDATQVSGYTYAINGSELKNFLQTLSGSNVGLVTFILRESTNQTNEIHFFSKEGDRGKAPSLTIARQ